MLRKIKDLQRIEKTGVIAVIRAESPGQALKTTEAVMKGGIDIIEITLTVPGAIEVIAELNRTYPMQEILLGAGTVLDAETARAVVLAGARFIVSPGFSLEVVKLCNRYQLVSMQGCMTVTEIITAMEAGTDVIKLFPGDAFGPSVIKAFKGPLPQADFIPTGGVSLDNVGQWIANGCVAVGVGGELTRGTKTGDFDQVSQTARDFVEKVKEARMKAGT